MARLTFEDVTKVFRDGTVAVDHFNLEVPDGSIYVVVGPSGSGKTTLLRIAVGLETETDGRILLDEEDVTERSPRKRDIAMVFQNYALYPHMTVYDNMAFGLRNRHVKKAELDERVRRVAGVLGLDPLLARRPKALSGGERQRVAIGRAIVRQPQAFLMDEPLSDLDSRMRADMRGEIARIQREFEVTTLYVTHDQAEALVLGDRVAVMRHGTLQQVDAPSELYARPANLFVAGFIGSPPMNLAEATVEEQDGGLFLRFGGHRLLVDGETLARRPRLRTYAWRQVVVGIRPEDLALPDVGTPDGARIDVLVNRREEVGADVYLHFMVDAPLVLEEEWADDEDEEPVTDVADDEVEAEVEALVRRIERVNMFLARVDEASGAGAGDRVRLAVKPGRIHVFDPRTGEAVED